MSGQQGVEPSNGLSGSQEQGAWLKRVLGYNVRLPSDRKKVRFAPAPTIIDGRKPPMLGSGLTKDRKPAKSSLLTGAPREIDVGGDRKLEISKGSDGRISLKAPPPPIGEITFSGGGGKGAALPGAVRALFPIMKDVTVVKGASVGSLTASLVAAGIDPGKFEEVSNDPNTTRRILENRSQGGKMALARGLTGNPLTGQGMHDVVREQMNEAASVHIDKLLESLPQETKRRLNTEEGEEAEEGNVEEGDTDEDGRSISLLRQIKEIQKKIKDNKAGLTFKDLRTLHQLIPEIKEVEISATMMGDSATLADSADDLLKQGEKPPQNAEITEGKRQLAMFNADTQPDMEVAKACQASAALPPVFSPVDIELEGGIIGKFMDGGVMNNAPSSKTVQSQRDVDPMPPSGALTYTFQSEDDKEDQAMLSGRPKPGQKGYVDNKMLKAEHTAGEYAKSRLLADSPDDIVIVPLKFPVMGKDGKQKRNWHGGKKEKDFSSLLGGTVNFNISEKSKLKLQEMTAEATEKHLEKRKQPKTTEFASVKQMLNCISESDLAGLAQADFEGAKAEQTFRNAALDLIKALIDVQTWPEQDDDPLKQRQMIQLKTSDGKRLLEELQDLTQGDVDRLGFVAREMSRSGKLDDFLKATAKGGDAVPDVVAAGVAVADSFDAKAHAQNVLREVIYPRMTVQNTKTEQALLLQVDDKLRAAETAEDVDAALDLVIDTFTNAKVGRSDKRKFADECRSYKLGK